MIHFELDQNEATFVVQAIGNLPTQSNAHPLWAKLVQQYNDQQQQKEAAQAAAPAAAE